MKTMTNWLYPQIDQDDCFDLMEKAAILVINKDKSYPKQQFGGIGAIAKAVYSNRIFAFRYKHFFKAKLGQILGGAISHSGILLIYQGHVNRYNWDQIISCKVTITTIMNNNYPNGRSYSYSIDLGFGNEEFFTMNPNGVNFFEFGGRVTLKMPQQADSDDEKVAELFALYYNRVRSEKTNFSIIKNEKKVYLHYPINPVYGQEIFNRFNSPNGIFFKKKLSFMRLEFTQEKITIYKRKKKKIEAIIKWKDIENIIVALGASYSIWIISYREGVDFTHEFIWPNSWNPEPPVKMENSMEEKHQRQMILPLCWLEMQ